MGLPLSSKKRTQKFPIPGPLITAPRITFLPFFSVTRLEVTFSAIISLSPESVSTSCPFNHHMLAELAPALILTFSMSSGQSITVTTQTSMPYRGLSMAYVKWYKLKLNVLLSSAYHFSSWFPILTVSPFLGTKV